MIKNYESEIMKLSNVIKDKIEKLSKRHKILINTIYEDLDVLLSNDSTYVANKIDSEISSSAPLVGSDDKKVENERII